MRGAEETGEPSSARVKGDPTYNTIALSHPPMLFVLQYKGTYNNIAVSHSLMLHFIHDKGT